MSQSPRAAGSQESSQPGRARPTFLAEEHSGGLPGEGSCRNQAGQRWGEDQWVVM